MIDSVLDYNKFLNAPTRGMRASPTFAVKQRSDARKAQGLPVLEFGLGEPAESPPAYIFDGLAEMLKNPAWQALTSHYTVTPGLKEARQVIAQKLQDENGLTYSADEIALTNGGKQAVFNAWAATLEKGDAVLLPEPSWVSYADMVKWLGSTPVSIPTGDDFKLTPQALEQSLREHPDAKWLLLNSPSNPTGVTYTKEEMKAFAHVLIDFNERRLAAKQQPILVLTDDIYEHMVYDDKYLNKPGDASAVSHNIIMADERMKPYTVIANGLAKAFAMTGWHVGYLAGPAKLIKAMSDKVQGLATSSISGVGQMAAMVALSPEHKAQREAFFTKQRESYKRRRDLVAEHINEIEGLKFMPTPGAFYAMVDCSELVGLKLPDGRAIKSGGDFANYLIDTHGVAAVPGDDFFVTQPEGKAYFRMAYATDDETIRQGIGLIAQAVREIRDYNRGKFATRGTPESDGIVTSFVSGDEVMAQAQR